MYQPIERVIGDCFYLSIPVGGSDREVAEWLDTSLFIEKTVEQLFNGDGLSIYDIHDLIQSHTSLNADRYLDEVQDNLDDAQSECLILIP